MTVDGEHDGHTVIRLNGSGGHEDIALVGCLDCLVIVGRLFLCEYPTLTKEQPCRHSVSTPGDRCDSHTDQALEARTERLEMKRKERVKQAATARLCGQSRPISSAADIMWLQKLFSHHGEISGHAITFRRIKRGQASMLMERYGGYGDGSSHDDWQWRCEGSQAARISAAVQTV
jgi:hypothetical protein